MACQQTLKHFFKCICHNLTPVKKRKCKKQKRTFKACTLKKKKKKIIINGTGLANKLKFNICNEY